MAAEVISAPRVDRTQIAVTGEGLIAETFPRLLTLTDLAPPTQTISCTRLGLRAGDIITNCHCAQGTLGTSAAPTLIKMALLDKTGKVLNQSANLAADTMWTTTVGTRTVPLGASVTITADDLYYVAFLMNGVFAGVNMTLSKFSTSTNSTAIGAGSPPVVRQQSQTDFAANNSSQTLTVTATAFWFGVS